MFNFIIGMFVGSYIGIVTLALCVTSAKESYKEDRREWNDEENI